MKILIAVPSLDFVSADFAMALAALLSRRAYDRKFRQKVDIALFNPKGSIIMEARNACVVEAKRINASHIFFLDSDVVVPPDTLERLIAHGQDFVCASYVRRYSPHELLGEADNVQLTALGNLMSMKSVPLGCALVSMSAINMIDPPYFRYITRAEGTISEDTYFCALLNKAGVTRHLDPDLTRQVGHVGTKVFRQA